VLTRSRVFFFSPLLVFGAVAMPTCGSSEMAGRRTKCMFLCLPAAVPSTPLKAIRMSTLWRSSRSMAVASMAK
jgi:hypothetical protein